MAKLCTFKKIKFFVLFCAGAILSFVSSLVFANPGSPNHGPSAKPAFNDFTFLQNPDGSIAGVLSTQGVAKGDLNEAIDASYKKDLAPRGSAALTSAGELAKSGIKYVIHAAPAAMGDVGAGGEPTRESIRLSIANSLRIATKMKIPSLAIPLIGGGIFLNRLQLTKEELALLIMDEVRRLSLPVQIVFVAYTDEENSVMRQAHQTEVANTENYSVLRKIWYGFLKWLTLRSDFAKTTTVVQGSIVDYSAHHCVAIMNAANMELSFGGGLSGVIGKATEQASEIDEVGQKLIQKYRNLKN